MSDSLSAGCGISLSHHPLLSVDYPRTPAPQGGNEPVYGLPHFLWQDVSPLGPQFPIGCLKYLQGCCPPPPAHLWLCLLATVGAYGSWTPLGPFSRSGPHGPRRFRPPSLLHQSYVVPDPGANSRGQGRIQPPVPAPRANPCYRAPNTTQSRTCSSLGRAPRAIRASLHCGAPPPMAKD